MKTNQISKCVALASALIGLFLATVSPAAADQLPVQVRFLSLDKKTMLTGYLFAPTGPHPDKIAAIVMMHGRAGAYSSKADGRYDASTLSKRHAFWGIFGRIEAMQPCWSTDLGRAAIRKVFRPVLMTSGRRT